MHVTVFLVSLKAGGVALNLTEASTVFLMDSWWNPAVEYRKRLGFHYPLPLSITITEAMDRIHRLGQHRPVKAVKIVIEDSIESRIIQLQEKKMAMVDATLSADDQAMGRLTPEDASFLLFSVLTQTNCPVEPSWVSCLDFEECFSISFGFVEIEAILSFSRLLVFV